VPDVLESDDRFRSALASGGYDCDGYSDLAIGISFKDFGVKSNPVVKARAVGVLGKRGHPQGSVLGRLDTSSGQLLTLNSLDNPANPAQIDCFGLTFCWVAAPNNFEQKSEGFLAP